MSEAPGGQMSKPTRIERCTNWWTSWLA